MSFFCGVQTGGSRSPSLGPAFEGLFLLLCWRQGKCQATESKVTMINNHDQCAAVHLPQHYEVTITGGKKKPLKTPKKEVKELTEVLSLFLRPRAG